MDDLGLKIERLVADRMREILARKEEIVEAFLCKYGCQPDEVVVVERPIPGGGTAWYVTTREELGIQHRS